MAKLFAEQLHQKYNWTVGVITRRHTSKHNGLLLPRGEIKGIQIVRVWSYGKVFGSIFHFLGGLWYLLLYGRGGIYHAHDLKVSSWMAIFARYFLGGRAIIKLRSGVYKYRTYYVSKLARLYFILPLRLADRVVVVNEAVGKYLVSLGITRDKIVLIPSAIDMKYFSPLSALEKKVDLREMLKLPANKTIFLYVGRMFELKGVDVLLKGWSLLSSEVRRESMLLLVGHGESVYLSEMISSLQIEESVYWAGTPQDVRNYYWASDVFVLASRTEGHSVAFTEAMACGLPVIASSVGCAPDLIQHGETGLLFESEAHDQLAECITKMLGMAEQWETIGERAREKIAAYADIDVCVAQMDQLYRQLE